MKLATMILFLILATANFAHAYRAVVPVLLKGAQLEIFLTSPQQMTFRSNSLVRSLILPAGHQRVELPYGLTFNSPIEISSRRTPDYVGLIYKGHRTEISSEPAQIHSYSPGSKVLYISNLSRLENPIRMEFDGKEQVFKMAGKETRKIEIDSKTNIMFRGNFRFESVSVGEKYEYGQKQKWTPPAGTYFLVANPSQKNDSFLIQLKNENLIQQARNIIKSADNNKIVSAKIKMGSTNNWNAYSQFNAKWSWSIETVHGFYDLGSQSCDGTAEMVENDIEHWVNQVGHICFWSYRLIKEIKIGDESKPTGLESLPPQIPQTVNHSN